MKNFIKMVMCLCAGIIATNAMEPIDKQPEVSAGNPNVITFDGNEYAKGCDYIKFDVDKKFEEQGIWAITKVSINEALLEKEKERKEITIKIRGFQDNRSVIIGEKAFQNLDSEYLKIKLQFEKNTSCPDGRARVGFPSNCGEMFMNADSITEIDLSGADLSSITSAKDMFANCHNLTEINFGNCTTPKLTNMSCMFLHCESLEELDLSNFNTSKVTSMFSMFWCCKNLKELNVSSFNTSEVTNMLGMFYYCKKLKFLNLRNFYTGKVMLMSGMFSHCEDLEGLELGLANEIVKCSYIL